MNTFDITKCPIIDGYKRCKTRDGRDVRILCEDLVANDGCAVVVAVKQNNGTETVYDINRDGYYYKNHIETGDDLVSITIKKPIWVNVYENGQGYVWDSIDKANDRKLISGRIARIKVEYEEGQFDE